MGAGSWDVADWGKTRSVRSTQTREEIFSQTRINPKLDPKNIVLRESCDSEEHPNSTPIILALDVTGSMGFIAEAIAKDQLGKLMGGIFERRPIEDPQIMFMAIGDTYVDRAPLQVSQFESDIRIAEQIVDLWLEGNGGGNDTEGYDLPWHFAATRTKIDRFTKRNKKGYLFTIGDECPPRGAESNDLKRIYGTGDERSWNSLEMLAMAQEKYEVFHVVVEEGSYARQRLQRVMQGWKEILGTRVIPLDDYNNLSQVILAVLEVAEGKNPEQVINESPTDTQQSIRHALELDRG